MCQTCWESSIESFCSPALGCFSANPIPFCYLWKWHEKIPQQKAVEQFETSPLLQLLTYIWLKQCIQKGWNQKYSIHWLLVRKNGGTISSPDSPFGRCWDPLGFLGSSRPCRGWKVVGIMIYEVWYVIFVHCIICTVIDATAYMYCRSKEYIRYFGATRMFTLCPVNQFAYAYLLASEFINWSLYNHDQQAMIIINFQGVVIMICCVYY